MSFSVTIKPTSDVDFDEAVRAATIPEDTYPESRALFAKGQEALLALARELPRFGAGGEVGFAATISGHAVPDPPTGWFPFNSLCVSVAETAPPTPEAEVT